MDKNALEEIFSEQACWRDQKAVEFPDDHRNKEAASHLRMLATSARDVDDTLLTAAEELYEDAPDVEAWGEMLRAAGMSYFPATATDFLSDFIRTRSSGSAI